MDPYVVALLVIVVLALLFFGYAQISSRGTTGNAIAPSVQSQYVGGGCGR